MGIYNKPLPPALVREIVDSLQVGDKEVAFAAGVSERTMRRWLAEGVDGVAASWLRLVNRLHAEHMPWREGEVAIRLTANGIELGGMK